MSSSMETREKLLSIIDDMELIAEMFFELIVTPKCSPDISFSYLADLLVLKDQDLKTTLKIAAELVEIQKEINVLQIKVDKQDQGIHQLQKCLKEAEHILSTAICQAKAKMENISKANGRSVTSEELIKYAHCVSACNAVAAPHSWQPGDNGQPYPTDLPVAGNVLQKQQGNLSEFPTSHGPHGGGNRPPYPTDLLVIGNVLQQQQGNLSELPTSRGPHGETKPSQAGTFTWQVSGNIKPQISTSTNHCVSIDTENEVGVMFIDSFSSSSSTDSSSSSSSTDSSSSSSSDSQ